MDIILFLFFSYLFLYLSKRFIYSKSIAILIMLTLSLAWYVSNDFTGNGIDDSFIYTITNSVNGVPIIENIKYVIICSVIILFSLFVIIFIKKQTKNKSVFFDFLFFINIILFFTISTPSKNIQSLFKESKENSNIEVNYITNDEIYNSVDGNYIFIIAESLERSFKNLNGNNYLEKISALDNQVDFSNIGYVRGSGWTIAGHVNLICGLPLIGTGNAADKINTFLPKATCFSDIIKNHGYDNIYISGSNTNFAGTRNFLNSHSFSKIIDLTDLDGKYKDAPFRNSWGLDDQIILDEAFDIFNNESKKGKNFSLYISTINTHTPGYMSKNCNNKSENQYIDSVVCADQIISDFIKKIQLSDYYENTTIVLISDHGLMHWKALIGANMKRTNLFTVFNKKLNSEVIDTNGTVLDQIPTALEVVSKKDTSLGFGRSIYSKSNSLNRLSDEFNSYARSLWVYPSLNNKIIYKGKDSIKIGGVDFALPICIYFDRNKNITEFGYEDGFSKRCFNDIKNKTNDNILILEKCENELCITIHKDGHTVKTNKIETLNKKL